MVNGRRAEAGGTVPVFMLKPDAIRTRTPVDGPGETLADPDAELVVRSRTEAPAFGLLYRRYVDPVYRYCHRRLGSKEAAEDATGQVFAKALAALPDYREAAGSFRGWLFTIAHNVVVDALRARRPTAPFATAVEHVDPAATPEELALAAEARRTLRDVLARLSPDQRQVVELHLAGLTGPEIATVLGRGHDAVRAVQSRAVARLRALLTIDPREEVHDGHE